MKTNSIIRTFRHTVGTLRAYQLSPLGTILGLAREALGIEDQYIEEGKIRVASEFIRRKIGDRKPKVILTLGSGLGDLADKIENRVVIPYNEIPCFPHPQEHIEGHAGNLVIGSLGGKIVAGMQGRFHLYQGLTAREVVRSVRTLIELGSKFFIVTNAAGGINANFKVGDLMLISDDFNLTFTNPLVGPNIDHLGPRFPDMSSTYSPRLRELARKIAAEQGLDIKEGVYTANLGPNYERPFEIQVLKQWGIDAVGMSTVPEVLAVNHTNAGRDSTRVEILGISLITNLAAGISKTPLSHKEVKEAGDKAAVKFEALIKEIIKRIE
jgi:purine-nucleoside phosphorylase